MTTKQGTSYRLSPTCLDLIEELTEVLGISKASVIEQAVRLMARQLEVTGKSEKLGKSARNGEEVGGQAAGRLG